MPLPVDQMILDYGGLGANRARFKIVLSEAAYGRGLSHGHCRGQFFSSLKTHSCWCPQMNLTFFSVNKGRGSVTSGYDAFCIELNSLQEGFDFSPRPWVWPFTYDLTFLEVRGQTFHPYYIYSPNHLECQSFFLEYFKDSFWELIMVSPLV